MTKIINTAWHAAHQYELFKVPDTEWFQIVNTVRHWGLGRFRPKASNLTPVPYYEKGKYDLAVLHVDQQCVDPTLGKSRLYKELNEAITDIPKIVINHGTPFWPEVYEDDEIIRKMKILLAGNHVIYNSHRAKEMWEKNGPMGISSRTIIHGMDANEWYSNPKEPIVVTTISPAGLPKYYNRRLLTEVQGMLKDRGIAHIHVGSDWVSDGFDDYRDFISRALIYFNPTLESPMPRSRTEAMLSGACVVTLGNHGAETFIKNGENGLLVPNNPQVIADIIEELVNNNYRYCVELGKKGMETAHELFSGERFRGEWRALLNEVTKK